MTLASRSKELWTTLSSLVGGICTYQIYMYGGQRWLMPMRRGQKLRTYSCRLLSPWWECRLGRKQRAMNGKVEASIADLCANKRTEKWLRCKINVSSVIGFIFDIYACESGSFQESGLCLERPKMERYDHSIIRGMRHHRMPNDQRTVDNTHCKFDPHNQ